MTVAEDMLQQLIQEFLDEAVDRISKVQVMLSNLRTDPSKFEAMGLDIRREVHGLKGMGTSLDFPSISLIAHRFEDYMSRLSEVDDQACTDLLRYADAIAEIVDKRKDPGTEKVTQIIQDLPVYTPFDPSSVTGRIARVLVVTRNRTISRALGRELAACGYLALNANDAIEAIRIIITSKPDLVLTSAVLDIIDGFDLIRALHGISTTRDQRVAVVTSYDRDHPELRGLPEGVGVVRLGASFSNDLGDTLADVF